MAAEHDSPLKDQSTEPTEVGSNELPRLIEAPEDADYSSYLPYIWASQEALVDGEVSPDFIASKAIRDRVADALDSPDGGKPSCDTFFQTSADPNPHAPSRSSATAYLGNPFGVLSATIVGERGGFFYGKPSRLLLLRVDWHTRSTLQAVPPGQRIVAATPEVTMAFGDQAICARFSGTTDELLSAGKSLLFFPPEVLRPDGIVRLGRLEDLIVPWEGEVRGAKRLLQEVDLSGSDPFQELTKFLWERMGPPIWVEKEDLVP